MKILFLCHRMPYPPKRGGKIRPFNMIRHLARSHEVTVATLARTAQERADGEEFRRYCDDLHVGHLSGLGAWARFGLFGLIGDAEVDVSKMCKQEAHKITWSADPLDILVSVVTLGLVGLRSISVECGATPGGPK